MGEIIKNGLILFAITIIAGGLLGATYEITEEPIQKQQIIQRDTAFQNVLKDASFEEMTDTDLSSYDKIESIFKGTIDGKVVGYAFKLVTYEGYGGEVQLVAGISEAGKITGIDIVKQSETPGLGAKADEDEFKSRFIDKDTETIEVVKGGATGNQIDAIGGATITSRAVTGAVNEAINYFNDHMKGGQ